MPERTGRQWQVRRRTVYFLLTVVSAIVTPVPNVITMLAILLPAIALFEVGYFLYRRSGR